MSFKLLASLTSIAGTILGLRFIFFPSSILTQWGLPSTEGSLVLCRRYGALYLGLATLFFLGRNAPPSELRSGVCVGIGGATGLLAVLGLGEYRLKRVGKGMIGPAVVETVMAAGFAWAWWREDTT